MPVTQPTLLLMQCLVLFFYHPDKVLCRVAVLKSASTNALTHITSRPHPVINSASPYSTSDQCTPNLNPARFGDVSSVGLQGVGLEQLPRLFAQFTLLLCLFPIILLCLSSLDALPHARVPPIHFGRLGTSASQRYGPDITGERILKVFTGEYREKGLEREVLEHAEVLGVSTAFEGAMLAGDTSGIGIVTSSTNCQRDAR